MIEQEDLSPLSRSQVIAVLLGSGAVGFFLGMVRYPAWQDALEPAQVLAGIVRYPPENPVYLYSTRVWTVLHDVLALLLTAGFSELTLALLVSGVMGMVSLQALGLVVLALGRDVPLAILSPFFIMVTNATSGGVTYGVALMGAEPTYGVLALSYVLMAMALIGVGWVRSGAWMLGFAPALHPTIGACGMAIVGIALALDRVRRPMVGQAGRWLVAGTVAAALCALGHYLWLQLPAPRVLPGLVQHWDGHRRPWPLFSFLGLGTYFSAVLPALVLWRFPTQFTTHARVLLRALAVTALMGGVLSFSYWLTPADRPSVVAALMPSRLLNLNVMTCMALIIGMCARYRRNFWIQTALAALITVLLALTILVRLTQNERAHTAVPWVTMGVAVGVLAVLTELDRRGRGTAPAPRGLAWMRRAATGVIAMVLAVAVVVAVVDFRRVVTRLMRDRTNDPLLAAAAGRRGLLLTGSNLHQKQLQTRRPVLLDGGALDALIYVPEAAPETDRILQRVYGAHLPALVASHASALDIDAGRDLWEARTPEAWQQIAQEFEVTDVLTYRQWKLQLPVVASNDGFTLYAIPADR